MTQSRLRSSSNKHYSIIHVGVGRPNSTGMWLAPEAWPRSSPITKLYDSAFAFVFAGFCWTHVITKKTFQKLLHTFWHAFWAWSILGYPILFGMLSRTGRFWATLLLCTLCMRSPSQWLWGVSGVATHPNKTKQKIYKYIYSVSKYNLIMIYSACDEEFIWQFEHFGSKRLSQTVVIVQLLLVMDLLP